MGVTAGNSCFAITGGLVVSFSPETVSLKFLQKLQDLNRWYIAH